MLNQAEVAVQVVEKRVELYMASPERRRRAWLSFSRAKKKAESTVRRSTNRMIASFRNAGTYRLTSVFESHRDPTVIISNLADWDSVRRRNIPTMTEAYYFAYLRGVEHIEENRIQKQRTDPIGVGAMGWAEENAAVLVTLIDQETRVAIRAIILNGIDQGLSMPQIGRQIRPLIGLNRPQAASLAKYYSKILETGISEEKAVAKLTRKANALLRKRELMITRTETSRALNEGILQGYKSFGITWVEWVADPEACEHCAAMNGSVMKLDEASMLIPDHPKCECVWVEAPPPGGK